MLTHRIAIGLLLCHSLIHEAMAQGINRRYDPWGAGLAQWGWSLELKADGDALIFCNTAWQDSLFYSSVLGCLSIDQQGEFIDTSRFSIPYHASYAGWSNASDARSEGGYVVGGNTYVANGTSKATLFLLDQSGAPEVYWEYGNVGEEWIGRQAKQTLDGGYVVCGETSTTGVIDAFLVKTDAQGELEWVRTYGGALQDYFVTVDLDGGRYFLGGQRMQSVNNTDLWVQCVNDTGGVVWSKIWGTPFDEPNAHLMTATDGNVLIASAWGTEDGDVYKKYLAKLDRVDGSIIWDRTYGAPCQGCPLFAVVEAPSNGDLVAVGHTWDAGVYHGTLLRTTADGDSLWMRNYLYTDANVNNGRGMLRDVQPTPDGGFIAAGVALAIPGQYTQDVWVVKVDSMGCLEPGCHLIQGMATQITNMRDALSVAPNPVAAGSSVQVTISLPASFTPQGGLRLTVVSSEGRVVQEQPVSNVAGSVPLSIGEGVGVRPGLYHIHLSDATRWISGAKLVVE